MSNIGPAIVIEDDPDDQEVMASVFQSLALPYKLVIYSEGGAALNYLKSTSEQPFIILTDINLPGMSGIEFREEILKDAYLRGKSIPFVFLTTTDGQQIMEKVYQLQIQGFFQKANSYKGIQTQIKLIFDYWKVCKRPNS
jgi:CheY-like chemotaxis protein